MSESFGEGQGKWGRNAKESGRRVVVVLRYGRKKSAVENKLRRNIRNKSARAPDRGTGFLPYLLYSHMKPRGKPDLGKVC